MSKGDFYILLLSDGERIVAVDRGEDTSYGGVSRSGDMRCISRKQVVAKKFITLPEVEFKDRHVAVGFSKSR